jgi:hypothetical protein
MMALLAALLCELIVLFFTGWMVAWFATRNRPVKLKGKGMK